MPQPQESPPQLHYRNNGSATVVGFANPYLQAEDVIEKVGAELFDLVEGKGFTKIVLSFSGVRFVSSAMLAQVVKLHKKVAKAKGRLAICSLTPALREVLRTSHLDKMLEVFDSESAALAKF